MAPKNDRTDERLWRINRLHKNRGKKFCAVSAPDKLALAMAMNHEWETVALELLDKSAIDKIKQMGWKMQWLEANQLMGMLTARKELSYDQVETAARNALRAKMKTNICNFI
jgi:hypothetical protein